MLRVVTCKKFWRILQKVCKWKFEVFLLGENYGAMPVGANIVRPRNCAVVTALHGGLRAAALRPIFPSHAGRGALTPPRTWRLPHSSRVVENAAPYRKGGFHIRPQHLAADVPLCEPMQASAPTGIFNIHGLLKKAPADFSAGADYLSVFIFRSRPGPCGGSGGPPARGGWSRG